MGCRHGSDPSWLWLWRRPAATARIDPLAWEPPYATGSALIRPKKKKERKKIDIKTDISLPLLTKKLFCELMCMERG